MPTQVQPSSTLDKVEPTQIARTYKLTYRMGNRPPTEKFFIFAGELKEATERARAHCQKMKYVYIFTSPFLVDLDHQEAMKEADPQFEPWTLR